MKRTILIAAFMLGGCAAPQYTVLGAAPGAGQTVTTAQAWPQFDAWEASAQGKDDVGIIVAIEDYAFLPDVPGAIQNANDWENYFRKSRGMKEIYTLTDKAATTEEIRRFIDQATANAKPDAAVWFVFIGHGAALKDGTDGALIGMDAQQTITSIEARSIPRKQLIASLEKGKQAQTLVVLDACFSGRDGSGELLAEGTQPVVPIANSAGVTKGTVVFSAAAGDEIAGQLPGAPRPAFSYLLLGGLRGWASQPGSDVSTGDLDAWLRQQFRQIKGRQQTPSVEGDEGLVLAKATEEDPGVSKMMRGETTTTTTTTTAVNTGGGSRLDSGNLEFTQPKDGAFGNAGLGVIVYLSNLYGGGEIMVSRMPMEPAMGAQFIQNAHDPQFGSGPIGAEKLHGPEKVTFGNTTGVVALYDDTQSGFEFQHLYFDTYQAGAVFRFELKTPDAASMEAAAPVFEAFISTAEFK